MREGMFIKKNVDRWNRYQHEQATDPDALADRFTQLVDDLSYAQTFYPRSQVTRWLNGIASGIYLKIYRNRGDKYRHFFRFWSFSLPYLFRRYHRVFLFTLVLFAVFTAIGAFSAAQDEDFIRGILGDEYLDTTHRNIETGDPFGIYKDDSPFASFVFIAIHNTSIAFTMAIGGLTLGWITFTYLLQNGLMLGSFHYLFFEKGLGTESLMVVWIHGTIEITSLILAATAGFIIARGILFPGTHTRLRSLRISAGDALRIMVALVPLFILASLLENYVTYLVGSAAIRQQQHPVQFWINLAILVLSVAGLCWYFIVLPILLHRKYPSTRT